MAGYSVQDIEAKIGQEVGVSDWITIDQDRIDQFAEVTEDHQFIHVDPERAAKTPFGKTIAHGFLSLSLLSKMAASLNMRLENLAMGINYGFDKVRFLDPVTVDSRVRARFVLKDFQSKGNGRYLFTYTVTVEAEGREKPALLAEWLSMQVTTPA